MSSFSSYCDLGKKVFPKQRGPKFLNRPKPVMSFGLLAWDSNKTAHQQFLLRTYQNFMESGISETEIGLNFWVSASNELGKVWEEDNFRFADFRMIRISSFPVFLVSGFHVSGLGVNLQSQLNRRFIRGCSSYISIFWPETKLLSWFPNSRANSHLWKVVLPCYLARNVTRFHLLLAWDSNMAANQQFQKHICWNFVDSCISGIVIRLKLWVSARNELCNPYFS